MKDKELRKPVDKWEFKELSEKLLAADTEDVNKKSSDIQSIPNDENITGKSVLSLRWYIFVIRPILDDKVVINILQYFFFSI